MCGGDAALCQIALTTWCHCFIQIRTDCIVNDGKLLKKDFTLSAQLDLRRQHAFQCVLVIANSLLRFSVCVNVNYSARS